MLADFFYRSIFSLVKDHFILFKEISSLCIDGHDQRASGFHIVLKGIAAGADNHRIGRHTDRGCICTGTADNAGHQDSSRIRAAQLVQEDMLDLALVNMHFYEIDKLNSYQILTDRIVFCVSPRHPLAGEKELTIEQIKDEPLILYNTDSVQSNTMAGIFESCGVKPNIVLRANQLYTIQKFIEQDLGGAFLYECLLKNMPGVVHIPITPRIEQEIGIIWPKGKYMNSRVEKFVAFSRQFTLMR